MKKTLIALAAMAAAGVASAQSSVTLFGIVDVALERGTASEGGAGKTQVTSGAYNTSRLGVRGSEDLGGGMSASFWLEAGINADDGSGQLTSTNNQTANSVSKINGSTGGGGLTFNRRSTVSLGGGFGEVRLGRDYAPTFWNHSAFDPFGTVGVGSTMTLGLRTAVDVTGAGAPIFGTFPTYWLPTQTRASNSIGYFLPANLGGVYGQAMYHFGENAHTGVAPGTVDTTKDGDGYGVRVGFAAGMFNIAVAHDAVKVLGENVKETNIGGQVDFGVARLTAIYNQDKLATDVKGKSWLIGGFVPVGAGEIRASYSQYKVDTGLGIEPKTSKFALGYVHNLSKRSAVYATVARAKNTDGASTVLGGATPGVGDFNSTGFDLGIRHSF